MHLLREVDDGKDDLLDHERLLSNEMHKWFALLKVFIGKNPSMDEPQQQKKIWDAELQAVVGDYLKHLDVREKV